MRRISGKTYYVLATEADTRSSFAGFANGLLRPTSSRIREVGALYFRSLGALVQKLNEPGQI